MVRILDAYLSALADRTPSLSVLSLCSLAEVSRTTFYKHFETLDDLDDRFLHLFFGHFLGFAEPVFTSRQDLEDFYLGVVRVMRDRRPFFEFLFRDDQAFPYRMRWLELIDDRLRRAFERPGTVSVKALWDLHQEFSLGVIHVYWEKALSVPSGDLDELTHWMMEYLWGALVRFRDLVDESALPMDRHLNLALGRRLRTKARPEDDWDQ